MKLQKPRPERWPLTAARASNAASKRKADGLSQASASNAANFGLHHCSLQAGNASATPSDEIAAACASTMAQRSLEDVTAVSPRRRKQRALPTQPASERLTACRKPLRPTQQTLGSTTAAFKRGTFLQLLAMKLLRPAPQLWPDARLKTLQPSALAAASRADAMPNTRDEMSDDPARPQRNR